MLEPTPAAVPLSPQAGPSTSPNGPCSLEHLDNLCRLMEKLGELRDHNSQLQRRVQYLEDLKGLRGHAEASTVTAEEAIMKATEERFLGPASTSNARSFVKIGKRSGKFKPLQYSMSHTFGEEGSKRKESKWTKVKEALRWDRNNAANFKQTSPCSSAGQSPNVKRSVLKPPDPDPEPDPSNSGSSSSEELDPYFTLNDITGDYDGANQPGSPNSSNRNEDSCRRSKSLEGEALFNHLRGVSTNTRQNRSPWGVVKGLIKTAKAHRHENSRLSFPSDPLEIQPENSEQTFLSAPLATQEDIPPCDQGIVEIDTPLIETRDDTSTIGLQNQTMSVTEPRRPSKWTKVKKAFLSGPVGPVSPTASTPNSPNKHTSFVFDPDWDVSEDTTVPRDEIRRSYLSLQQRISQEFQRKRLEWERRAGGNVIPETSAVVENDTLMESPVPNIYGDTSDSYSIKKSSTFVSIPEDQQIRNQGLFDGRDSPPLPGRLAWQRLRKSRTAPSVPLGGVLNAPLSRSTTINRDIPAGSESPVDCPEKGLKWLQKELSRVEREKIRLERERDRFLRREAKQRRQEVLVRTSGGLFRFQGISSQFTRRLFEWERSQGIPPQDSTLALLQPNYAGDSTDLSANLARSRSEGIVGAKEPLEEDEEEDDGLKRRLLRFENTYRHESRSPPRLLRPKDFKARFSERRENDEEFGRSSPIYERDIVDNGYLSKDGALSRTRFRPKVRARGRFVRQSTQEGEENGIKRATEEGETVDQRQAAVLVSALSTQLLTLAQELEVSLGSKQTTSSQLSPTLCPAPSVNQDGDELKQLPTLLTNTVLQLRQGLKVLCKDHAEGSSGLEGSPLQETEKIQSGLGVNREENEDEERIREEADDDGEDDDDEDEDEREFPKRWNNKRKLRKIPRKSASFDQTAIADVFVPTTRKIFSPMTHDPVRSVVTYVVDEPTKDSDTSSTASSDHSERITSPLLPLVQNPAPVITPPVPTTPSTSVTTTATTPSPTLLWKSANSRNMCSVGAAAPAWLRTSGSRSQSSSPALRRRLTPPALLQSPGTTRRDKEAAPSIRMMIARYNQSPSIPTVRENGASSPVAWKSPVVERRVRLQMERYEQGIRQEDPPGCVQKSASVGTIKPAGILKSSSVGSIKLRSIVPPPPPPAVTAARLRTLRLQRAKQEFLSRAPEECCVPLIKSASAGVIEQCSKNACESDMMNHGKRLEGSPKIGVSWRLRKVTLRSTDEESPGNCRPVGVGCSGTGLTATKSCPSSPVLERIPADESDVGTGRSNNSSGGWMRFPGRIFRQK